MNHKENSMRMDKISLLCRRCQKKNKNTVNNKLNAIEVDQKKIDKQVIRHEIQMHRLIDAS